MRIQPQVSRVLEVAEAGAHTILFVSADPYEPRDSVSQALDSFGDNCVDRLGPAATLAQRVKVAKPCPCGALLDPVWPCVCEPQDIVAYWRAQEATVREADIVVEVARPRPEEVRLILQATASLDIRSVGIVMEELKMISDSGKSVILVTHDFRLKPFADRIIYVNNGIASDKPSEDEIFHI